MGAGCVSIIIHMFFVENWIKLGPLNMEILILFRGAGPLMFQGKLGVIFFLNLQNFKEFLEDFQEFLKKRISANLAVTFF